MMTAITIRSGRAADLAALDALFAQSYAALLAPHYTAKVLQAALPLITKAQPDLVTCGSFFVADLAGQLVGAGGWTRAAPGQAGAIAPKVGHIRHFVTDATMTRQGIARRLMAHVLADATDAGVRHMRCQSTLAAEPFYHSAGFSTQAPITIPLAPGVAFPAILMQRGLP